MKPVQDEKQRDFREKLEKASDDELREFCRRYIWLSAYANNNPHSDFHWMCDFCYDECKRRDKISTYTEEHSKLSEGA